MSATREAPPSPTLNLPIVPIQSALSENLPLFSDSAPRDTPKPSDSAHPERTIGKSWHLVQTYQSHGAYYYRYAYSTNGSSTPTNHHIPGGNTLNPIAQARATEVNRWISLGKTPKAIVSLIDSWRRGARQK